jgi:hypothetical protein
MCSPASQLCSVCPGRSELSTRIWASIRTPVQCDRLDPSSASAANNEYPSMQPSFVIWMAGSEEDRIRHSSVSDRSECPTSQSKDRCLAFADAACSLIGRQNMGPVDTGKVQVSDDELFASAS